MSSWWCWLQWFLTKGAMGILVAFIPILFSCCFNVDPSCSRTSLMFKHMFVTSVPPTLGFSWLEVYYKWESWSSSIVALYTKLWLPVQPTVRCQRQTKAGISATWALTTISLVVWSICFPKAECISQTRNFVSTIISPYPNYGTTGSLTDSPKSSSMTVVYQYHEHSCSISPSMVSSWCDSLMLLHSLRNYTPLFSHGVWKEPFPANTCCHLANWTCCELIYWGIITCNRSAAQTARFTHRGNWYEMERIDGDATQHNTTPGHDHRANSRNREGENGAGCMHCSRTPQTWQWSKEQMVSAELLCASHSRE